MLLLLYLYECYTNKDSHTTQHQLLCPPHPFERRVTRHARDYVPLIQSTSDRSSQLRDHLVVRLNMENNSVPPGMHDRSKFDSERNGGDMPLRRAFRRS